MYPCVLIGSCFMYHLICFLCGWRELAATARAYRGCFHSEFLTYLEGNPSNTLDTTYKYLSIYCQLLKFRRLAAWAEWTSPPILTLSPGLPSVSSSSRTTRRLTGRGQQSLGNTTYQNANSDDDLPKKHQVTFYQQKLSTKWSNKNFILILLLNLY